MQQQENEHRISRGVNGEEQISPEELSQQMYEEATSEERLRILIERRAQGVR